MFFNGVKLLVQVGPPTECHATVKLVEVASEPPLLFPVLASGWICYAEKTHGNAIIPYISTARSPQQVMGSLVKDFFAQQQVTGIVQP